MRNFKKEVIYYDKYRGLWKNATYVEKFGKMEIWEMDYVLSPETVYLIMKYSLVHNKSFDDLPEEELYGILEVKTF